MAKRMLIDALHAEETRIVIADDSQVYDFDYVSTSKKQLKGNIYLAKITRVEPSLQAAFVEYGGGKQGFLPFSEIHADYYQIPTADRKRLMEEAEREESASDNNELQQDAQQPGEATYGEQPIAMLDSDDTASGSNLSDATEVERPAYLMQEALVPSVSEEALVDDTTPISALLDAPESHALVEAPSDEAPEASTGLVLSDEPAAQEAAQIDSVPEVETITDDEEYARPKRNNFFKRYKIQEVIRRGQVVLVQVIKEERGNKGCSLTTYLSLAGRYCVLMPNSPKDGGVSRKIASVDDRKRLKAIYTELKLAAGMSVIIRTAGMDRTRAEIKRDYDYLVKLWNQIREDTLKSTAPALIYEESDIIKRAIRDQYVGDIEDIIVEGEEGFNAAREFMKLLMPSHTPKIKHYKESTPLFYAYNIEEQLLSMHDPIVKLKSGGYIVINPTEALISIDVNSGRSTGERNIEETAAKTNLEAAAEVARQLRLRDLAGLIVIDFIDMMESRNRRNVEKMLKDSLKADRAKIQLGRISPFGLLEMSRQRLRSSVAEINMTPCPHCLGRGLIRSAESMSIQMIRSLEKEASNGGWGSLRLIASQTIALHLLNTKRDHLRSLEERHNVAIQVLIGPAMAVTEFTLEKVRRGQGADRPERDPSERGERGERYRGKRDRADRNERAERPDRSAPVEITVASEASPDVSDITEVRDDSTPRAGDRDRDRKRRRRGGRGRNNRERPERDLSANPPVAGTDQNASDAAPETVTTGDVLTITDSAAPTTERGDRPRRSRGGRGRRNWRDNDRGTNTNAVSEPVYAEASGQSAPAFVTNIPMPAPQPAPHIVVTDISNSPPPAPKKGWWKKIIELDD